MTREEKYRLLVRFVDDYIPKSEVFALFGVSKPEYCAQSYSNADHIGMFGHDSMNLQRFRDANTGIPDDVKELIELYLAVHVLQEQV